MQLTGIRPGVRHVFAVQIGRVVERKGRAPTATCTSGVGNISKRVISCHGSRAHVRCRGSAMEAIAKGFTPVCAMTPVRRLLCGLLMCAKLWH